MKTVGIVLVVASFVLLAFVSSSAGPDQGGTSDPAASGETAPAESQSGLRRAHMLPAATMLLGLVLMVIS